ncbi:MAG: flagellar basal body P-ring formation chaperone FlgA [Desulfatitalea sp.]
MILNRLQRRLLSISLQLLGTLLLVGSAAAADPVQITMGPKAAVDNETIRLGKIADISGGDAGQAEALREIEIGRAPLPGQSLLIHRSHIEMRLKQNNIDPDQYRISDAGPVKVTRNHIGVTDAQIRGAVESFIQTHAPWSADQMKIRPIEYSQSHKLPPGEVTLQVMAPKHSDWLGAVPFQVQLLVDGEAVKRTSVPAYIEVWQEVVLAAKPLGRNQPITREDLQIQTMNLARVPSNAIVHVDQVLGRRANRAIAVNSVLRIDQVELPPIVRKGDVVQVLAESARLKITTQAVAQENGAIGQKIQVMNVGSKKNIHAQVIDAQTVRIDF